jgi:hypothetical protein
MARTWAAEHQTVWRLGLLALVVAAMAAPWTTTSDGVGYLPKGRCDSPLILLGSGRCVKAVSGAEVFAFSATAAAQLGVALLTGELALAERVGEIAGVVLLAAGGVLLLLPFLSTLLLTLRRERLRIRVFQLAAWAVAGLVALMLATSLQAPGPALVTWGGWITAALAAAALAVEVLARPDVRSAA